MHLHDKVKLFLSSFKTDLLFYFLLVLGRSN